MGLTLLSLCRNPLYITDMAASSQNARFSTFSRDGDKDKLYGHAFQVRLSIYVPDQTAFLLCDRSLPVTAYAYTPIDSVSCNSVDLLAVSGVQDLEYAGAKATFRPFYRYLLLSISATMAAMDAQ